MIRCPVCHTLTMMDNGHLVCEGMNGEKHAVYHYVLHRAGKNGWSKGAGWVKNPVPMLYINGEWRMPECRFAVCGFCDSKEKDDECVMWMRRHRNQMSLELKDRLRSPGRITRSMSGISSSIT